MAVTNNQQAQSYNPAFMPQKFESLSNQYAFSDFQYRVVCTDLITLGTQTYNINKRPTNYEMWFDASVFSKNYIKHYIPRNVYGFQRCTDAIRQIRVNVGEYYSAAYTAGSNYDYIIWNSTVRSLDWVYYTTTDYVYKSSTSNWKYLTSDTYNTLSGWYTSNKITYADKSHFIYCLSSENNDFQGVRINCYDSGGTLLSYSDIANPFTTGTTYTDKYVAIDVGHKGLTNIESSKVTGTYPIFSAGTVSYYDVIDADYTTFPVSSRKNISRIYIECETRHTVYTLHYLAKSGNFETLHFAKVSELRERVEKKSYKTNPNTLNTLNNTWGYGLESQWEKVLSSTGQEDLILNTDWLTVNQMAFHREIVTSPLVYIDYGSSAGQGMVPVKVLTSEILVNKDWNNRMFAIQLNIQPTYVNNYQFG